MSASCLFCRIIAGEIPAKIIAESPQALAFHDIAPQAPLHVLVIPRAHYASLAETPDGSVMAEVSELAKRVAREFGVEQSGYRVVVNTGDDGGQTVHHLHLHVLAGRQMKWPPG
ncbi:histidine triad nucleotide-binding protein [Pseudogemmatithrix spongiicola]|uniref:Histidine triad nucleotide-binding protein n=1 Tax=Pseudogemmatithrix spongiicola TaxID=3062599 RepID=A0AA49JUN5_9BACT|nr:histidine triad nucleotide-binding protein [Gemmatimonadaceae bacterium 'strain 138']WKW15337.1 histidine triad nucleotide-binding protein [Gemmatimonadaceae bacterium 'strain 318']